jgi:enoyl-[acyl-carrier protein] reductase III
MANTNIKGRTALVTGGSRGIGRAISIKLAQTVAKTVFVNYLENDTEAHKTAESIEKAGAKCILAKANLAFPTQIEELFETIKSNGNGLDSLIHCAAINTFKPLKEVKSNQWDLIMNVNARSLLLCARHAAAIMSGGHIVAISSLGSTRVIGNYGAMGPTKSALESTLRYLAVELAPEGIRVNGVSGGIIATESISKFPESEKLVKDAVSRTPANRLGTPVDIADVVMFLINDASNFIYGQTIVVDGGLSLF